MENFVWNMPTRLHFGKDVCDKIQTLAPAYGKKALLMIGGGSVKKNGILRKIEQQLSLAEIQTILFEGIYSNPRIEEVREATQICRTQDIDFVVAIGGGSVIDSAKAVVCSAKYENDPWDLFTGVLKPQQAIPLMTILTLAATGTEMNAFAVVQNKEAGIKTSFGSPYAIPKDSFLDPTFTVSVPRDYTAFGLADIVAHSLEVYFGGGQATLSDRFAISIIKEVDEFGPELLKQLDHYELRAKMMYASTCALNGLTNFGKRSGDWGVHDFAHNLSFLYDVPHGASLSVVYPAWLHWLTNKDVAAMKKFAKDLCQTDNIEEAIEYVEQLFVRLLCPINMRDLHVRSYHPDELLSTLQKNKVSGYRYTMTREDYQYIIDKMQ